MPKGQTLLEVLISATIIIVGIVSLVTLIVYTQSNSRLTYQEAIALGLAQEAVEAARFVRDGNWLEREAGDTTVNFYDGLYDSSSGLDYSAIYYWRPVPSTLTPAQAITFDFTADTSEDASATVYKTLGNLYRQTSSSTLPGGWTATPYTRFITLYPICSDDGGLTEDILTADGQGCATSYLGSTQIGVQVIAQVSWSNGGETLTRSVEERLYNWKYAN